MTRATEIPAGDVLTRPANVVASEIEGDTVIMDITTGRFLHLNRVGSAIWSILATPMTADELCATLEDRFDVDASTCRRDAIEFVDALVARDLLMTTASPG